MEASLSEGIALLALFVSVASAYYTKNQTQLSRIAADNNYRAYLSENHGKYRALLKEVDERHRDDLKKLSRLAGTTLKTITDLFDVHDTERSSTRHLRHLIDESAEMVYYTFKGELASQFGVNIAHRFVAISRIEDRLKPQLDFFGGSNFRRVLKNKDSSDGNYFLETELASDTHFCNLVSQMKARIDFDKRGIFLADVQENYREFAELWEVLKPRFAEDALLLERALEENEIEDFRLAESPGLFRKLKYIRTRLDILSNLQTMKIESKYVEKYNNYISISIYICAVLRAVQDVHSWGWRES